MVGVTGEGVNFWASENLSGRVHFEGYSPEWRVLSKLSVQPCEMRNGTLPNSATPINQEWIQFVVLILLSFHHWIAGGGAQLGGWS